MFFGTQKTFEPVEWAPVRGELPDAEEAARAYEQCERPPRHHMILKHVTLGEAVRYLAFPPLTA